MTYFTVRKFTTTGKKQPRRQREVFNNVNPLLACFRLQLDFGLLTLLADTGNTPYPSPDDSAPGGTFFITWCWKPY